MDMHVQIIVGKTFCERYDDGMQRLKTLKPGKLVLIRGAANVGKFFSCIAIGRIVELLYYNLYLCLLGAHWRIFVHSIVYVQHKVSTSREVWKMNAVGVSILEDTIIIFQSNSPLLFSLTCAFPFARISKSLHLFWFCHDSKRSNAEEWMAKLGRELGSETKSRCDCVFL